MKKYLKITLIQANWLLLITEKPQEKPRHDHESKYDQMPCQVTYGWQWESKAFKILEEIVKSRDDGRDLVVVVMAVEKRFFSENHAREHATQTPQIKWVVVQLWPAQTDSISQSMSTIHTIQLFYIFFKNNTIGCGRWWKGKIVVKSNNNTAVSLPY